MAFNDPLFQLGMDLTRSSTTHANRINPADVAVVKEKSLPSGENLLFNLGVRYSLLSALTPVHARGAESPAQVQWMEPEQERRYA